MNRSGRIFLKSCFLLLLCLPFSFYSSAQYTTVQNGPWIAWQTWGGIPPGLSDIVIIKHKVTVAQDWGLYAGGSITIDPGASLTENLPGRTFGQYGGTIINNGTFDFANFAQLGGQTTNNDSMRFNRDFYITTPASFTNNGVIADVDSVWNDGIFSNTGSGAEIRATFFYNTDSVYNSGIIGFLDGVNENKSTLVNDGIIAGTLCLNSGEFKNLSGSSFNAVDFWNNAQFYNYANAAVNVSRDFLNGDSLVPISGPLVYNDGFFGVGRNWYNADSISGVTGSFCIGQKSINWGYIGGTVDICDNTGGAIDQSTGPDAFIEPTVTYCSAACGLVVSFNQYDPTCSGGADGSIALKVYGGTGTYTYNWDNGNTTDSAAGLTEGAYVIVVSDANDSTVVVVSLYTPAMTMAITATTASCGMANGTASTTVSKGAQPYTFQWSDPNAQTTPTAVGLSPGAYGLIVTDADGCIINDSVLIGEIPNISVTDNITAATCPDAMDGVIDLTVTGGTAPYDYLWDPDVSTDAKAIDLAAGDYSITVTDADLCTYTVAVAVTVAGGPDCVDWKIFSGITPNGDGIDDQWEIRGLKQFKPVDVKIFTNRGVIVWSSDDYTNDWEGTDQQGNELMEGVYYYIVTRPDKVDKGWVHIVR